MTREKVAIAQTLFEREQTSKNAADFLSKLREAEEIGLIDDDEFHNGLALVETYLWTGGSIVHERS